MGDKINRSGEQRQLIVYVWGDKERFAAKMDKQKNNYNLTFVYIQRTLLYMTL